MKNFIVFFFLLLGVRLSEVAAQVTQAWADSEQAFSPVAILVDGSGNVIVGGVMNESLPSNHDWVILKYNADGMLLWRNNFYNDGNDSLADMKIDDEGNLYACGRMYFSGLSRHANIYTAKINGASGSILWDRNYSYRQTGFDEALALVLDKNRNVFVTGSVEIISGISDLVVIKYDSATSGTNLTTAQWIKTVDGGTGSDVGTCIGVASAGRIYVGGYSAGPGSSFDFFTVLLSHSGNSADTVWTRRYTVPLYIQIDQVVDLVVDDSYNVIVTGVSRNSDADFRTIKYSLNGEVLWNKRYNFLVGLNEIPTDIAIDNEDNVYITGTNYHGIERENIFTIKYRGSTGDTIWTKQINGPLAGTSSIDRGIAVSIGSDSAVYVGGYISTDTATGLKNFYAAKLNHLDGTKIWDIQLDGNSNNDFLTAITLDAANSVYITGTNGTNGLTAKYFTTTSAITGQVLEDFDGDTATSHDREGKGDWRLFRFVGDALVESTLTNDLGFYSFRNLGVAAQTFTIVCDSGKPYWYSAVAGFGGSSQQVLGTRTIQITIDPEQGKGISYANNFYSLVQPSFCTVPQETLVLAVLKRNPDSTGRWSWANVRDSVLRQKDLSTTNDLILGVKSDIVPPSPFPPFYGFARISWYNRLLRFLPTQNSIINGTYLDSSAAAKPFLNYDSTWWADSTTGERINPYYSRHKNHLAGEQIALKMNIFASELNITPRRFGYLQYFDNANPSDPFNGYTIYQISAKIDSALSFFDFGFDYNALDSVARKINNAFLGSPYIITKSPIRIWGCKGLSDVPFLHFSSPTTAIKDVPLQNTNFLLSQNYPNPFNPKTTVSFFLPHNSTVTLKIYNILGQEVKTLLNNEKLELGNHVVDWNASNVSSGVYFYRLLVLRDGKQIFIQSKKLMVVK
ncbi:MAG: T9SS type A sorting domain-containing protein [Ignavibacteriales bacterium]|nr:T9SS type A sorting domain-containing protein [Ignavibacteriales bacterium]